MPTQNEVLSLNDKIKFDKKGGSILGILEGPVADYEHPTRNGRFYGEKLWDNVWKNPLVMEQFKNGGIVGELDHPVDRDDICTEKVAILMSEPPIKKNGVYYGKFNILDTPCGRIVYTLAKAGFKLGVSSRGTGDVDEYTEAVDPSTFDFTCFDIVLLPAVESARMQLVTESLDSKKLDYKKLLKEDLEKANATDKKVMEETLNHLGINLDEGLDDLLNDRAKGKYSEPEAKKCVICGEPITGYGNNAEPVKHGRCCDKCNQEVVIPARLKQSSLKEDKDIEELNKSTEEPKDLPDIQLNKDLLEPETIDDIELEKTETTSEKEISDIKLIELLHKFFKKEDLKIDEDKEKNFIELFHEIVCPKCSDMEEKETSIEDKLEDDQEDDIEVEDNESKELIEQLQKLLQENSNLKEDVKKLQNEKAVSNTKVIKLNEDLQTFKAVAATAGKKAMELKSFETKSNDLINENKTLKEKLEEKQKLIESKDERISTLMKTKQSLIEKTVKNSEEIKNIQDTLDSTKTDSNRKLTEANERIIKAKKLIEKYKNLAHEAAERYIERRAIALGISKNEILNRLNESYTLDDVDKLCEELSDYSLNISRLPFTFDKPGNARVRIREDHSKDPLKNMDSQYDDDVDDYLLDLAGLNK